MNRSQILLPHAASHAAPLIQRPQRAAAASLSVSWASSEAEVREALTGNLCRCTGYQGIVDAALAAAKKMREAAP